MEHSVTEYKGCLVVSLVGDVDLQSSPEARLIIIETLDKNKPIIIDLSGVDYIDSSGVASLVEGFQKARKKNAGFVLVSVSEGALRVLKLARLDKVFTICDTLDHGIAAL